MVTWVGDLADAERPGRLVIVSDCADDAEFARTRTGLDFDRIKASEAERLARLAHSTAECVEIVVGPEALHALAGDRGALVWPYWNGENSRSRQSLVQSLCECLSLPIVGADAYARFLCADKALAKAMVARSGISVTEHARFDLERDFERGIGFPPPYIVKPNNEDGSVEIDDASVFQDERAALVHARALLRRVPGSVLVERFLPGREVNLCCLLRAGEFVFQAVERQICGEPDYFRSRPFGASVKRLKRLQSKAVPFEGPALNEIAEKARDLFERIGTLQTLRLDGRVVGGHFYCFEISPLPNLNHDAEFLSAMSARSFKPEQVVAGLVADAWARRAARTAVSCAE